MITFNSAAMIDVDDVTGSLMAGKSTNFIVIDRDPFEVAPGEIGGTCVL